MTGLYIKYFVLSPTKKDRYGEASRAAMREYARVITSKNERLASDLFEWVAKEESK